MSERWQLRRGGGIVLGLALSVTPFMRYVECGGDTHAAAAQGTKLVAADRCRAGEITCDLQLADGTTVRMTAFVE
jgi:hypothetical protein